LLDLWGRAVTLVNGTLFKAPRFARSSGALVEVDAGCGAPERALASLEIR
jgi:hypothetical protein